MQLIEGVIEEVIFRNEDNGYTIAVFRTEDGYLTCTGNMMNVRVGAAYSLEGKFVVHPKYGEQFAFSNAEQSMPSDEDGIIAFLASGAVKGVGPKMAATITGVFGKDTFRIIEEEPEKLTRVPGIGVKKAETISESFISERILADISVFFKQYDIDVAQVKRIYNVYGEDTIERVKEDPYEMVDDIFGIGFVTCDRMAQKMGAAKDDPQRIRGGVIYVLQQHAGGGHTFLPKTELAEKAGGLLDVSVELIEEAMTELIFTGQIKICELEGRDVCYLRAFFMAETAVAADIRRLVESEPVAIDHDIDTLIDRSERRIGIEFSDEQRAAVQSSLTNPVCVITGGPGTGKTTIISGILDILSDSGIKTAIAAPTGRAAKRITETTGYDASTIHRLLEYSYYEGEDDMRFGRNRENPLDADAVVIDEMSMVDLLLMHALVQALKSGVRLIMVGDADQLPSVGAGNVLEDLLASEYVETMHLSEIFRQAAESMIVVNAHRIDRGEYPSVNDRDSDFFLVERDNEEAIADTITQLVSERLPAHYQGKDRLADMQVLTPVKKGLVGTWTLNQKLQAALNPPGAAKEEKKYGSHIFREGDKVMQTKNNYDIEWKRISDFEDGTGIFNGDMGMIEKIDQEYGKMTVVFDEDKYVRYDFAELEQLEPAFAVTVHKSQGSEFPIVVMPMTRFPWMLATRNLLYTAVTRGAEVVVIVGGRAQMNAMIDNDSIRERYSGLGVRLKELY